MSGKTKLAKRHPVSFVADELGLDRMALHRRLKAAGVDYAKGVTFREAFEAWIEKASKDADHARRQKAEADTAEITAAEKMGLLMLKSDVRLIWADATIEFRQMIQSQPSWESGKLLVALSKIKARGRAHSLRGSL